MADQLRADYLSCYGHPTLETPNIDALATRGMKFDRAYCNAAICGPSRMSFYTGRTMASHGCAYNRVPIRTDEWTLSDYMRAEGLRSALVGKTHFGANPTDVERLNLAAEGVDGRYVLECGFEPYERDDGLHPMGMFDPNLRYNQYLREQGYVSDNPWNDFVISALNDAGDVVSGFYMRNAHLPARVSAEHSETAYMTRRAIDFIREAGDEPWSLHLSYIKPHWPYIVPAPYHNMYSAKDILPAVKDRAELQDPHPVYEAFATGRIGKSFSRDDVREKVIPVYMGLIKQCDDQMGRLLQYLEDSGRDKDTMIIITSDHGDYLGDHWLGEKDLFHAPSVKVPLIIYDPRPTADKTRGTTCSNLVEAIDVTATIIDAAGCDVPSHIVEGRSLMPYLEDREHPSPRSYVISEYDYSSHPVCRGLDVLPKDARMFMVATEDWKLVHCEGGLPPMLFDLKNDPNELIDLGRNDTFSGIRAEMYAYLHDWSLRMSQRVTMSDAEIAKKRQDGGQTGVVLGLVEETDAPAAMTAHYRGTAPARPKS